MGTMAASQAPARTASKTFSKDSQGSVSTSPKWASSACSE